MHIIIYCNVCVYVCIAISCTCMCVCTYVFGDHLVQAFSLLCHPSLEKLIIIIIIIIDRESKICTSQIL